MRAKHPQDNQNNYYNVATSARVIDINPQKDPSAEFLKIVHIPSPKRVQDENMVIIRKKGGVNKINFKKNDRSDLSISKSTVEESLNFRDSSLEGKMENLHNRSEKDIKYRNLIVSKQDSEKAQEERQGALKQKLQIFEITTSTKEAKQPASQYLLLKDKSNMLKVAGQQKEGLSEMEKRKIYLYFKNKVSSLTRAIEEKIQSANNAGARGKLNRVKSLALAAETEASPTNDTLIVDEIWRILKVIASTKSKYRYRDIVNYQKRLRETIKNLLPVESPGLAKNKGLIANINLEDEGHGKGASKASKAVDPNKASDGDFAIRRKENPNAKVFIIMGGYEALRKAFRERGWIENPDSSSRDFDLKWCSKLELRFDNLKPRQLVNHFEKSTVLTTKAGLARSIRNLIWYGGTDVDEFYPRCYDLNDAGEFDDYIEDFKFDYVVSMLRIAKEMSEMTSIEKNVFKVKLCVALFISERRLRPFDTLVTSIVKGEGLSISQEEWELLNLTTQNLESTLENQKHERILKSLKRRYNVEFDAEGTPESDKSLLLQAEATSLRLEKEYPQTALNQGKNIWIIKPAGLSRGRGICCYNTLPAILNHIQIKESEWVAQKYIENPLIIKNRKFDIRQWVLVTDWSPLTIYFYSECYVRFSAQDFNPDDLNNKFAHLTNNAIGKHAENFETSEIEGNMWDSNDFRNYLIETSGKDVFNDVIHPQMKNIVIKSLQSAHELALPSKNSFELYGYDFMIDQDYKSWLIEINSSPSMDYSTSITERMVKQVLEDCVKVVVDLGMSKNKTKKGIDIGNFECIHMGRDV